MRERLLIQEIGSASAPVKREAFGVDLQDVLIAAGLISGEAAAVVIWWPAALILACLFCFGFAFLIEMSKAKAKK